MLVRSTAESTANVNPHYLSRLPSERGLKRDVPTHARIYFRVPLVRRLRPATDAFWWPKRPLEISRSSVVSFFPLCASFIEKNLGVFWGVFAAGVDEKLVGYYVVKLFSSFFFSFGSRIENCELFENISREDGEKKYCFVYEDWRRSGNFDSRI